MLYLDERVIISCGSGGLVPRSTLSMGYWAALYDGLMLADLGELGRPKHLGWVWWVHLLFRGWHYFFNDRLRLLGEDCQGLLEFVSRLLRHRRVRSLIPGYINCLKLLSQGGFFAGLLFFRLYIRIILKASWTHVGGSTGPGHVLASSCVQA